MGISLLQLFLNRINSNSALLYDSHHAHAQNLFDGRPWSMAARVVLATETTDTTVPNLKKIYIYHVPRLKFYIN